MGGIFLITTNKPAILISIKLKNETSVSEYTHSPHAQDCVKIYTALVTGKSHCKKKINSRFELFESSPSDRSGLPLGKLT
jgi:hypothetical protein